MKLSKEKQRKIFMTTGITLICVSILGTGIYTLSNKKPSNGTVTTTKSDKSINQKSNEIIEEYFNNKDDNKKISVIDKVTQSKVPENNLFEQAIAGNYQPLSRSLIQEDLVAFKDVEKPKNEDSKQQLVSYQPETNNKVEVVEKEKEPVPVEPIEPPTPIEPPYVDPNPPVIVVDYSSLESLVSEAKEINQSLYLSFSLEHFIHEMLVSERLLTDRNASQVQVNNQVERLNQSISELVLKADKTELEETISHVEKVDKDFVTKETYTVFEQVLEEARKVVSDEEVTQEKVDTTKKQLISAFNGLVRVSELEEEMIYLQRLVTDAENLIQEDYTDESWLTFESALTTAKDLLQSEEELTVEAVQSAKQQLSDSKESLELKDSEEESEIKEPSESETPQEETSKTETEKQEFKIDLSEINVTVTNEVESQKIVDTPTESEVLQEVSGQTEPTTDPKLHDQSTEITVDLGNTSDEKD